MKITNAFSLNMLGNKNPESMLHVSIDCKEISVEEVIEHLQDPDFGGVESAVGHEDTANIFSEILGMKIPCERRTVSLEKGDWAIIGQYKGPRLPEGATKLPDGATITWFLVEIN